MTEREKSLNLWKWLGIGCGGCLLTSILAIAGLGYFIHKNLQFSTNSEEVLARSETFFTYEIPGGSRGLARFKFIDIEFTQIANQNAPLEVLLLLGKAPEKYGVDRGDLESISNLFVDNRNINFKIESETTSEKELCDRTVSVLIQQGELTIEGQSDPKPASSYTATVNYNDSVRFVWSIATGSESNEKASQVFNSLECK